MAEVIKILPGRTVLGVDDDGTPFELFHVSDPTYFANVDTALETALAAHKKGAYPDVRSFFVVEV